MMAIQGQSESSQGRGQAYIHQNIYWFPLNLSSDQGYTAFFIHFLPRCKKNAQDKNWLIQRSAMSVICYSQTENLLRIGKCLLAIWGFGEGKPYKSLDYVTSGDPWSDIIAMDYPPPHILRLYVALFMFTVFLF